MFCGNERPTARGRCAAWAPEGGGPVVVLKDPVRSIGFALLGVGVVAIGLGSWSCIQVGDMQEARAWVRHSYDVIDAADRLGLAVRDAERNERNYLITGQDGYLDAYRDGVDHAAHRRDELSILIAGDSSQRGRMRLLATVMGRKLDELARTTALRSDNRVAEASRMVAFDQGVALMSELEAALNDVRDEEGRLLDRRIEIARRADSHAIRFALGGASMLAALLVVCYWLLRRVHAMQRRQFERQEALLFERERAEEAARRSEEQLRLATVGGRVGTWYLNGAIGQGICSPEMAKLLGTTRQEIAVADWLDLIHLEDQARVAAQWRHAVGAALPYEIEYRTACLAADGGAQWLLSRGRFERAGARGRMCCVGVTIEITERKRIEEGLRKSEGLLQDLIGTLDLASVFIRDMDDRISFWSEGCRRLFGWSAEEAIGLMSHELLATEFPAPFHELQAALLRDGEWTGDLRQRTKDGLMITVSTRWVLDFDAASRRPRVLASAADVTALRRTQAALQRVNEDLEARVREEVAAREATQSRAAHGQRMQALGQLAGGIAHDFNNVLQAVQGGASLIAGRPGDCEGVRHFASLVLDAASRGSAITGRLLGFSRRNELRAEAVDPAALLAHIQEILAHTLGGGIAVRTESQALLPPLMADQGQLETVLVNLATNARDAMHGIGTLTVAAAAERVCVDDDRNPMLKPGRYIRLSVADTGTGMDAATLARATEPFFTTKETGKGTGLGLAMANGFAEQSGGSMRIDSAPGQGTTVSLWLPAATEPARSDMPEDRDRGVRTAAPRHRRLLLVDDDPIVREVIAEHMTLAGYAVTSACTGDEALAMLDAGESVDLVLTDLSMPGIDGLTLAREAQRRRPALPVILLTGFATDSLEDGSGGMPRTAFSLMRKPVKAGALAERVETMLEQAAGPAGWAKSEPVIADR
jgi:PAS domain S-box-containing protein